MGKKKAGKGKKGAKLELVDDATAPPVTNGGKSSTASAHAPTSAKVPLEDEWPDEPTPIAPPPESPGDHAELTPVRADAPTGTSERRIFRRVPFFRKIQYKFESMDAFRTEFANDISIGGMFIKTDAPEPLGAVIFLEFDLKDGSRILSGYGKVVRVNPKGTPDFDSGMGVEFMKFDEASMLHIKQLISGRFGR